MKENISIQIKYRNINSDAWETINLSPEDYFDLDQDEPIEYNCVPKFDRAIDYIGFETNLISHTFIKIEDRINGITREIVNTFWNNGNNSFIKRVDKGPSMNDILVVVVTKVSNTPPIWEILRVQENDGIPIIEFHSFITDEDDGTESERVIYPNRIV